MNKGLRLIKRLVALSLVLLLSIESFAAVVSDNDGSAFITKAEFDSLKNNFQAQIDQYNTSIDSKIDGAIASYLAGINIQKETMYRVEIADWGEVLCTNFALGQTWQMPSINLSFNLAYSGNNSRNDWWETWWGIGGITYKKPSTSHQIRNCVNAGQESTSYTLPNDVVWVGQSMDYEDVINGCKSGSFKDGYHEMSSHTEAGRYLAGLGLGELCVVQALNMKSGYVPTMNISSDWKATVRFDSTESSASVYHQELVPDDDKWISKIFNSSVTLNYVNGKQYQNEHIISWDNYDWVNPSDPNWSHTLGDNLGYTQKNVLQNSGTSKAGFWGAYEYSNTSVNRGTSRWGTASRNNQNITERPKYRQNFVGFYSAAKGAESDNAVKGVGILDKTYTSSNIYQWNGNKPLQRDEKIIIPSLNLCNGCIIGYAKDDEIFKWEPKITGQYYDTATSSWKPIEKWNVKLTKIPFGTQDWPYDASQILKNDGQVNDWLETDNNGVCKFKVNVLDATPIYCKWWPNDANICSNYSWRGILDLNVCGSYTVTAS